MLRRLGRHRRLCRCIGDHIDRLRSLGRHRRLGRLRKLGIGIGIEDYR